MADVASRAGVAAVTVSRVVNGGANVSPAARERVEAAIAELGFVPSGAARALRSKRSGALALILPDIQNPFWTAVARGAEDEAARAGYSLFIYDTDEDPRKLSRGVEAMVRHGVEGALVAPLGQDASSFAPLVSRRVPVVLVDRAIEGWDGDCVVSDSLGGARTLTAHLLSLGRSAIAAISGPGRSSTARDRVEGWRLAHSDAGARADEDLALFDSFGIEGGARSVASLLESGKRFDAIFAANASIVTGAIETLCRHGLRVPEDVAVACFDTLIDGDRLFPFLTQAVQPAYEMGAKAAAMLAARLANRGALPTRLVLPVSLVVRYSCGAMIRDGRSPVSLPFPDPAKRFLR